MIAIPNMDKPKSCWRCDVGKIANCPIWMGVDSSSNYKDSVYPDCPLIEIVRCKDCKYFITPYENLVDADGLCDNMQVVMDKTDFCSYGERRSDEADR